MNNEQVGFRKNMLVLGDMLSDLNMVDNIDYKNLIAIGFLNNPKNLEEELE